MRRSTTSAATDRRRLGAILVTELICALLLVGRPQAAPADPVVAAPASLTTPTAASTTETSPALRAGGAPRRRSHGSPRRSGRSTHGGAAGPHRGRDERRGAGRHRVLGTGLAARRRHRGRRIGRRVRQPRRRRPRHRGHHHRRADHVRPGRRRDERCVVANSVAPRAFPLRVARRYRRRRAALAHRRRRRFRRPPAGTAASGRRSGWRKFPPTPNSAPPAPPGRWPTTALGGSAGSSPTRTAATRCGRCICGRAVPAIPTPPPPCAIPLARTCRRCSLDGGTGCPASLTGDEPGPAG